MGGKRQSNSFSLTAKPRKQVQYWLRLSTQTVSVNSDGSTSPGYFTMAIMKTEEGVTTEMTTMPQGVTDGLAVEVYADGQLYVSFNDISDPTGLYQLFRSGNAGTDDWTVVSCMEFQLRARLTTVVYDTKTITAVPAGDDAVVYMLSAPQYVRFKYNHAGTPLAVDASLQLTLTKTVGNTSQRVLASLPQGMTLKTSTNGSSWAVAASQTLTRTVATDFSNGNQDTIWYGLFSGDTLLWSVGVQRRWEIQRMLMPAGEYQPKEYRQTVNTTPLVHCHVSDSLSEYWYLVGDTNDRGAGATPRYAPPSDQYPAIWAQASEFEVVLTKMLFADFARLGGFVVVGGFFFSQYGTLLYNNNGTVQAIGIDASNYLTLYGDKVPYGWFDATDPMAATNPTAGSYKFRPTKCMDAETGEEWMAGGNVHFRSDGSGELASGNISWDENGNTSFMTKGSANKISIHDGRIDFFGLLGFPNLTIGTDDLGCAVIRIFDENNREVYNLGPGGLGTIANSSNSEEMEMHLGFYRIVNNTTLGNVFSANIYDNVLFKSGSLEETSVLRRYKAARAAGVILAGNIFTTQAAAQNADGKYFIYDGTGSPVLANCIVCRASYGARVNGIYYETTDFYNVINGIPEDYSDYSANYAGISRNVDWAYSGTSYNRGKLYVDVYKIENGVITETLSIFKDY